MRMATKEQVRALAGGRLTERVSEEVRALMARRHVTQQQVADALGIRQPGISARLHGRVAWNADELGILADLFDVSPAELIEGVQPRPFPQPPTGSGAQRARRDSNPKPSDPKVLPLGVAA